MAHNTSQASFTYFYSRLRVSVLQSCDSFRKTLYWHTHHVPVTHLPGGCKTDGCWYTRGGSVQAPQQACHGGHNQRELTHCRFVTAFVQVAAVVYSIHAPSHVTPPQGTICRQAIYQPRDTIIAPPFMDSKSAWPLAPFALLLTLSLHPS